MNLQFYLEKARNSPEYKSFIKENPDAFVCSAFFIIDKEGTDNKQHIDVYVPSKNQFFSFQLEEECKLIPVEVIEGVPAPTKLLANSVLDFGEIDEIIKDEVEKQGIKNTVQKILAVLQNVEGKDVWFCTVFISMLGLLKVQIDDALGEVLFFEKKSFFDMLGVYKK